MNLHLIFARARNGAIGKNGTMPWHLPEDLAHFKRVTLGHPVIMGRKTWDSLPTRFRPLPGRQNIVITRQAGWLQPGVEVVHSLEDALAGVRANPATTDAWIIGGAEIYRQALPLARTAVVTEIDADFEGDAFAPQFDTGWTGTPGEWQSAASGLRYRFVMYTHNSLT